MCREQVLIYPQPSFLSLLLSLSLSWNGQRKHAEEEEEDVAMEEDDSIGEGLYSSVFSLHKTQLLIMKQTRHTERTLSYSTDLL